MLDINIPSVGIEHLSNALCSVRGLNPNTSDGSWKEEAKEALSKILIHPDTMHDDYFARLPHLGKRYRGFGRIPR